MAFDAGMVRCVVSELSQKLVGGRIDKIHQPEKDEILFIIRSGSDNYRLVVSASANNSRVHLSSSVKENPPAPPQFCILLRKHLASGRIIDIAQQGFERVIRITVESKDDMGYPMVRRIYAEIMGKYSNIILTDEADKILGVIKPVDFTTSQKRQVLSGMKYEMPPLQDKRCPLDETKEGFVSLYESGEYRSPDKFITANYLGISSLTSREIAFVSADETALSLWYSFNACMELIRSNRFHPVLICDENKRPVEYSFCDIKQYGISFNVVNKDSVSEVIELYFASRDNLDHTKQRASDLFKLINNIKNRLLKKTQIQLAELENADKKDEYKLYGDLITANIYALKKGMTVARLVNYYDESCPEIEIPLDSRLTPAQNAQLYYKKYTKARNAVIELEKQIEISKRELEYIESVLDHLMRAKGQSELDEIRMELEQAGYLGKGSKGSKKPLPYKLQTKPIEYRTSGGYRVLCGKNNIQNDRLTFKTASKLDWWFHVKNAPGSHVIMLCEKDEEPSERDFTEAAMIAAVNSSVSESKNIAVDYTQIKNIKKPAGAGLGFVIYHTNYSAYVNADAEAVEALKISS